MSFRDVAPTRVANNRRRRRSESPKIRALSPPKVSSNHLFGQNRSATVQPRPVVSSSDSSSSVSSADAARRRRKYTKMRRMEYQQQRAATNTSQTELSLLMHKTQKFQKLVADLEAVLRESGESSQMAWRARIMLRSAKESDRDMRRKLSQYEQTMNMLPEIDRQQQAAANKLYRDFQRSHTALETAVSLYEKRQVAEMSRLGATGDEGFGHEEDFFDRSMREREEEIGRMNTNMHKVNEIYQELAGLVDDQQEKIDRLEDHVADAKTNVESAVRHLGCFTGREQIMCGSSLAFEDSVGMNPSLRHGSTATAEQMNEEYPDLRVSETFHWYMPFETLSEDITAVQKDVLGLGKNLISNAKFKCGTPDGIEKDFF